MKCVLCPGWRGKKERTVERKRVEEEREKAISGLKCCLTWVWQHLPVGPISLCFITIKSLNSISIRLKTRNFFFQNSIFILIRLSDELWKLKIKIKSNKPIISRTHKFWVMNDENWVNQYSPISHFSFVSLFLCFFFFNLIF